MSRLDRSRYQGKNFALLIVATCAPAAVLYLRLVIEVVAEHGHVSSGVARTLGTTSVVILVLFCCVQLVCAAYLQRLIKPGTTALTKAFRFTGALLIGLLISITGAIMLEAFGINVLIRAGLIR